MSTTDTTTKGEDMAIESTATETRTSPQENLYSAEAVRNFIRAALALEPAVDWVNDLLFEHVVRGRLHTSVVTATLQGHIADIVESASREDWSVITRDLIAEARETLAAGDGDEESPR
jgi:hypothetical protein